MGGVPIIFLFTNIYLVSMLLWAITFIGYRTNKIHPNKITRTQYECGFKTTTSYKINVYVNSIVSLLFLLLYEIEFTLMIPYFFNPSVSDIIKISNVFFIVAIFSTFILDVKLDSVKWSY